MTGTGKNSFYNALPLSYRGFLPRQESNLRLFINSEGTVLIAKSNLTKNKNN